MRCGPKVCTAYFAPLVSSVPRTLLYIDSQPGDSVGLGHKMVFHPGNAFFKIDPHLESLREKAEFKRLVAGLEYKYTALKIATA